MEAEAEPTREGGKIDRDNLREFMEEKNFEVIELVDETEDNICRRLLRLSNEPVANYDVFICIIMAHGGSRNGYFEVKRCKQMNIETVMNYFGTRNCPALRDKPKIFLINTCRGNEDGHATQSSSVSQVATEADIGSIFSSSMFEASESDNGGSLRSIIKTIHTGVARLSLGGGPEDTTHPSPLPSTSDDPESENSPNSASGSSRKPTNLSFMHTILAFSTLKNFISWRSNVVGTVFIVSLLGVLKEHFATLDVFKILQLTGNRVLELSNNGQAIEIRTIACLQDIYLVPNTSLEIKQWLHLGCDDTTAVVLTPFHIERQARHLFAKGYKEVRHLVKDGKIKFTSAVSLESVGIEPLHTVYLFSRIQGTRFVPTVLGALAALQHIVYLSEVNTSFMKEEVLLKVVKEALLCFTNCIVPYNLSAWSTHRHSLLLRVREVLHVFHAYPQVRDDLATHIRNLSEITTRTYAESLTTDIAGMTSATQSELILLYDKIAEIVFVILRTACSDDFNANSRPIQTTQAAFVRRCFEALAFFPELTQEMCTEYTRLETECNTITPNVVSFLTSRENVVKIILNVLRNIDHNANNYTSYKHVAILALNALCKVLMFTKFIPIQMSVSRTLCLELLVEQLMSKKITADDAETNTLCVQVIEIFKNDTLFVNTTQSTQEMNTTQLHKVNHNLLVRLLTVLKYQGQKSSGDRILFTLFSGLKAVIHSTHFNKPVHNTTSNTTNNTTNTNNNDNHTPLDITPITQILSLHSQHLQLVADGLSLLCLLFPYKIHCTDSIMVSFFSSLLPLIRNCREELGYAESKTRLHSVTFILKNALQFLTERNTDPSNYIPILQQDGLMRELIELLLVISTDQTQDKLLFNKLLDLLPFCFSSDNVSSFCATIEGEQLMRLFIHNILLAQLSVRVENGAYGANNTNTNTADTFNNTSNSNSNGNTEDSNNSEQHNDQQQHDSECILLGHNIYSPPNTNNTNTNSRPQKQQHNDSFKADTYIHLLHLLVKYDNEVLHKLQHTLSTAGHKRAVLFDDYSQIALLMIRVCDFRGIGLVARLSVHHARVLAECGAIKCILNTITQYQQQQPQSHNEQHDKQHNINDTEHQQASDIPSWVRGASRQQNIATRLNCICFALSALTVYPDLIERMTDISPLLMVIYTHVSVKTYTDKYIQSYFTYFMSTVINIAKHNNEIKCQLGVCGMCGVAIELFAGQYPDLNALYALIVTLADNCLANCERLTPLASLIIDKLSVDFQSLSEGKSKSKKKQSIGSLFKVTVPTIKQIPIVNPLIIQYGVMTFRVLQTLMKLESIRMCCVEEDLFSHIVFVLNVLFADKVAGFETRHLIVSEILLCLRHACTSRDTIKRLCDTDGNSGMLLTNTLRRTRNEPIDRDLFFSSLSLAHVMITEFKAVKKDNKGDFKKYVQDLIKHIHSSEPPHAQTQTALSKLAGMLAVL